MKSILITGGSGSFGTAFVRELLDKNLAERICVYSRGEHAQAAMAQKCDGDSRLRFFIGDVRDRWRLTRACDGCDVVVHGAALKRIETAHRNPREVYRTNTFAAENIVDAAIDANVKRVVALSTDKAFMPISAYGKSKAAAEDIILDGNNMGRNTRFALVRYGNVWRSAGSVVPRWEQILEDGETHVPITDPECTRFFMQMAEAIDLVLNTIQTMEGGEINVPNLPAYRLGDLADAMGAKTITVGLPSYEKLHESMNEIQSSDKARRMTVDELRAAL